MKKSKWLYWNPPVETPAGIRAAYPIRLTVSEAPKHPFVAELGLFEVVLSAWFRDDAKPIGHDEQLTVSWRQDEIELTLGKIGQGLIALGQAMVKEAGGEI